MRLILGFLLVFSPDALAKKCPYYGYFTEIDHEQNYMNINIVFEHQPLSLTKIVEHRGKFYFAGWMSFPEGRDGKKPFCRPPLEVGTAFYECDGQRIKRRLAFLESRDFDRISGNSNFLANDKLRCPSRSGKDSPPESRPVPDLTSPKS